MVVQIPDPEQNHLLRALPAEVRERIYPHLKLTELPLGTALYESGSRLKHIYFPLDAIVSLCTCSRTVPPRRSPS
jgi:hypothetical protein